MSQSQSTLAFKVKSAAEYAIRQGHPWIFDESIVKQSAEGKTGDLAIIFDRAKNKFLGIGLYDADSPIRIKVLTTINKTKLDGKWILTQFNKAYALREPHLNKDLNSCRLIFGENDGLPGLIVDKYDDKFVVKLYSGIWIPYLDYIISALNKMFKPRQVILRLSRKVAVNHSDLEDGSVLYGDETSHLVQFKEHGVIFEADLVKGHKTGFFLDHRANRHHVQQMSADKTVLDVFSYAGGFSVHALVGGAAEVTSLDVSKHALKLAHHNAILNRVGDNHKTITGDAFDSLAKLINQEKTYDIVIIDPPSFAKQAKEVPKALPVYQRLAQLGSQLVNIEGTLILASCSSRIEKKTFFSVMEQGIGLSDKRYQLYKKTFHDFDHPITFPEGSYLKCGYWKRIS